MEKRSIPFYATVFVAFFSIFFASHSVTAATYATYTNSKNGFSFKYNADTFTVETSGSSAEWAQIKQKQNDWRLKGANYDLSARPLRDQDVKNKDWNAYIQDQVKSFQGQSGTLNVRQRPYQVKNYKAALIQVYYVPTFFPTEGPDMDYRGVTTYIYMTKDLKKVYRVEQGMVYEKNSGARNPYDAEFHAIAKSFTISTPKK